MRNSLVSLLFGTALCIAALPATSQPVQSQVPDMVPRGVIGVSVVKITTALAYWVGLPDAHGAVVASVHRGGPAAQAGVQVGDVILWADDHPIRQPTDLTAALAAMQPGDEVVLQVWRWRSRVEEEIAVRIGDKTTVSAGTIVAQHMMGTARRRLPPPG